MVSALSFLCNKCKLSIRTVFITIGAWKLLDKNNHQNRVISRAAVMQHTRALIRMVPFRRLLLWMRAVVKSAGILVILDR